MPKKPETVRGLEVIKTFENEKVEKGLLSLLQVSTLVLSCANVEGVISGS